MVTLALPLLLFVRAAAAPAAAKGDPPAAAWVERVLVILNSSPNYAEARAVLAVAARGLKETVDLRGLSPDPKVGLTLPRAVCEKEFGGHPCYCPRGRLDDGVYLSIEHSIGYKGFTPGLYIVVLASAGPEEREEGDVQAALRRARVRFPDAYIKKTLVYQGCMH